MFSALKRLTGKGDGPGSSSARPSHQAMSQNLQRKFAKGVQYNMKIIVKGDRNVGKTCLFQRLQGQKFVEEYIPTEEIQVASIQWSYKATDDIVKVEVWDVVDRGKKKKRFDGLKLDNCQLEVPEEPALDAEFLDVYKGTNGVIIMMDITKSWTFDYVQRELPKVPCHIPVLVLANHCDMSHHRTVTPDHVTYFIESFERPAGSAQVRYAEASMRNGFGLKLLHKFFNLPFLQLQRETLLGQLETNEHETQLTSQELDLYQESDDADYNKFLDNLMNKRRQVADLTSSAIPIPSPGTAAQSFGPGQTSQSSHQLSSHLGGPTPDSASIRRSASISGPIGAGNPIPGFNPTTVSKTPELHIRPLASAGQVSVPLSLANHGQNLLQVAQSDSASVSNRSEMLVGSASKSTGFMSKIFGKTKDIQDDLSERRPSLVSTSGSIATPEPITSVEEFVPDGGMLDRSFLEDTSAQERSTPSHQVEVDSDSDLENGNPLVASFQDYLDPDDVLPTANLTTPELPTKRNSISSVDVPLIISPSTPDPEEKEVSHITADALDSWLGADSKWRRSPDGGEDSDPGRLGRASLDLGPDRGRGRGDEEEEEASASPTSSNVHLELLEPTGRTPGNSGGSSPIPTRDKKKDRLKEKSEEKSMKKHKKKSNKDKEGSKTSSEEKRKKKRSSRRSREEERSRDELEEFLNGPGVVPVDTAYEAI